MKAIHRPAAGIRHEHEYEAVHGLPEALPPGETMIWQGSPDWRAMARRVFHLRKLALYFAALLLLRLVVVVGNGASVGDALWSSWGPLVLALLALGLVTLLAWLSARSAVYTITDKRVVMRIGIVLTLTFNLPFKRIAAAGLHLDRYGSGDIPLTLSGDDRIAWLHLWPHVRPWRLGRPEPMLRNVPQAAIVARLLAEAWSQATGLSPDATAFDRPRTAAPADKSRGRVSPAMAGR